MHKKRIAVIFGGASSEHEVSRVSAASVIDNMPKDKYDIFTVGITKDGEWLLTSATTEQIASGEWRIIFRRLLRPILRSTVCA